MDSYSPAGSLIERLERGGVEVVRYSTKDMVHAAGLLFDAILENSVKVRQNKIIDDAVSCAKRKQLGQSWLWARTTLTADLTPLFAMTLAHHHATTRQTDKPRSLIY